MKFAPLHSAYEVSPFYYGEYSLTTGVPKGVAGLGIEAGHRSVPVTGEPAPSYWGGVGLSGRYWDFETGQRLEALGQEGAPGIAKARAIKRMVAVSEAANDRVAREGYVPRRLRKPKAVMTPGGEEPRPLLTRPVRRLPHPTIRARGTAGFFQWLRAAHPIAFAQLERERPELLVNLPGGRKLEGLAQGEGTDPVASQAPPSPSLSQQIFGFLDNVLTRKHEKDVAEMQLEAAQAGQPPQVIVDAQTGQTLSAGATGVDMTKLMIPLGLGAAALLVFAMMR